ncbi:MAG: MmgE/PrpD family protein [Burkholderiales bacterium]|nr:MmgE/PrpD family protein [Burkholderiales bacterium]
MDPTITRLAYYATGLEYRDLSAAAVHECKRRLIDTLGCAVGGYGAAPAAIARRIAGGVRASPSARILGTGGRTAPELAAFANGVAMRYLDFNDAYAAKSTGHPSDVFAGVLAAADAAGAGGRSTILGAVAAYETFCNFSESVPREIGWDHVVHGVVACAVGAGKVLGLSRKAMGNAISLAVTPNLALEQTRFGELAMWKGAAAANAARNGLFAARLAAAGMTGPEQAIEGRFGLWRATGKFEWQPFGGRGGPFRVTQTHIKAFPSVVHSQSPITVALALHGEARAEDIEAIDIETYWVAERYADRKAALWHPATRETADHSLPYCVAAALIDGKVTGRTFSAARIRDPRIARLVGRTTMRENPEFSKRYPAEWPCRIEVRLRGGETRAAEVRYFKGHTGNPLTDAEIDEKFRELSRGRLDPAQCDKVLAAAWRLEKLRDVGELTGLFRFRSRKGRGGS